MYIFTSHISHYKDFSKTVLEENWSGFAQLFR